MLPLNINLVTPLTIFDVKHIIKDMHRVCGLHCDRDFNGREAVFREVNRVNNAQGVANSSNIILITSMNWDFLTTQTFRLT